MHYFRAGFIEGVCILPTVGHCNRKFMNKYVSIDFPGNQSSVPKTAIKINIFYQIPKKIIH